MTGAPDGVVAEAVAYDKARSRLKWVVRYRDGLGRRRRRSFRHRPEAVTFRRLLLAAAKFEPGHRPLTFRRAGENFAASIEEFTRHRKNESALRLHLYPQFGETWLQEIDAGFHRLIEEHIDALPVGPEHKYVVRRAFEHTLDYARERGWMLPAAAAVPKRRTAASPCVVARARAGKRRIMPTLTEVNVLLDGVEDWLRVPVYLALRAGLRLGEILALRWSDIDFATNEIHVRSSEPLYGSGPIEAGGSRRPPKTRAGHRFVTMTRQLAAVLDWWRRQVVADRGSKVVFRPSFGCYRPLTRAVLSNEMFEEQVRLGMARRVLARNPENGSVTTKFPGHYSFHQLRHAHVAILIWARVPDAQISKSVGHKSTKITTDMYGYLIKLRRSGAASWPDGRDAPGAGVALPPGQHLAERNGRTYRIHTPAAAVSVPEPAAA